MRLTLRDLWSTILVIAIGIPYVGYLVNGEMPFVKDPRGMSAIGLVLGSVALLVMRSGTSDRQFRVAENWVAGASLLLGLSALAFAEAGAADLLLAIFMGSILLVWGLETLDHGGAFHGSGHRAHPMHP